MSNPPDRPDGDGSARTFRVPNMMAILALSEELRALMMWVVQQESPATLARAAAAMKKDEATCRLMFAELLRKALVEEVTGGSDPVYRVAPTRKRGQKGIPEM